MKPSLAKAIHNSHRTAGRRHDDRSRGAVPIDRRRAAASDGKPGLASALVLAGDRFFAEWIQQEIIEVFPEMRLTSVSSREKAEEALSNYSFDLLLVLLDQLRGDAFELLARNTQEPRQRGRVSLVTARHDPQTLAMLRLLAVEGVVDPQADGLADFAAALRTVAQGGHYWSRTFVERGMPALPSAVMHRMLTPIERLVIGIVGDGCDDDTAAAKLGMRWRSVDSVRRELYRKLGVHRLPDLMRRARELGFVAFSDGGEVVRPGFSQALATARLRGYGVRIRDCAGQCGITVGCERCSYGISPI